jgi:hypothetical protein
LLCVSVSHLLAIARLQWYIDVVLALLERAGDFCGEDIWHRVVQLVTNNEQSQAYAAGRVVEVLRRGASHEALMCMAGYVLGEYGRLIKVGSTCVQPDLLLMTLLRWPQGLAESSVAALHMAGYVLREYGRLIKVGRQQHQQGIGVNEWVSECKADRLCAC